MNQNLKKKIIDEYNFTAIHQLTVTKKLFQKYI